MLKRIARIIRRGGERSDAGEAVSEAMAKAFEASSALFQRLAETIGQQREMSPHERRRLLVHSLNEVISHMDEDKDDASVSDLLFYFHLQRAILTGLIIGIEKHGDQADLIAWTIAWYFEEAAKGLRRSS